MNRYFADASGTEMSDARGQDPYPAEVWADDVATAIIKRVCEIDCHGPSPDNEPDLLRVTVDELRFIIMSELKPE